MTTAVVYFGDAGGAWDAPWFVGIPLVCGGLCVAAVVGTVRRMMGLRSRGAAPDPAGSRPKAGLNR
ncbi:hypothetical protein OKJ99_43685 [Streptomyces endophyticus]|uniref:Uncharacterized protein n=1 Tax=Streptomyces endophyticus TaxID=714166 RepID=A0ABU6FNM8_9ACTN|nr:hypothetical protein [Streptomyces endophyticus]